LKETKRKIIVERGQGEPEREGGKNGTVTSAPTRTKTGGIRNEGGVQGKGLTEESQTTKGKKRKQEEKR